MWFKDALPYVTGAVLLSLFQIVTFSTTGNPWGVSGVFANWGAWLFELVGGSVDKWFYFSSPGAQATLDAGRKVGDRLAEYNNAETRIQELQSEISTLSDELVNMADELTEKRTASAVEFSSRIVTELRALNMPLAEFHIERSDPVSPVTVKDRLVSVSGGESFSFLFTANTGMPAAALDSVASGGELSRVALALALIMADRGTASTLIFDEIDSGTGGETAHRLADSLVRASGARQIIVISHLAQVASRAFRHLAVEKRFEDGMPVTVVNHLNSPDSRISELARLLGGGDGARDHAVRLLKDWND